MWSVSEAGRLMNLSGQRVRKLLSEGRIKGRKIGSTWVILELSYTRRKRPTKNDVLYVQGKVEKDVGSNSRNQPNSLNIK